MATQPSDPKNLFAFLLGMLTLTQGLDLPTESLLQRRAAKVQKRNQFPTANGYLRDHCRKLGATRKFSESLTRRATKLRCHSSVRPVPIWTRQSLRFCPLFRVLAPSAGR